MEGQDGDHLDEGHSEGEDSDIDEDDVEENKRIYRDYKKFATGDDLPSDSAE